MVLNSWPMKPSGVQLARPILPPCLQTRSSLGRGAILVGREHHPEGRDDDVETGVGERQRFGVGLAELDGEPFGVGAFAGAIEQRGHVVSGDHLAPAPRGGEADVAVAGGHVEHLLAGADVEGLAQILADDLQGGADDRIVAGRPGAALAGLDRLEIDLCGRAAMADFDGADGHDRLSIRDDQDACDTRREGDSAPVRELYCLCVGPVTGWRMVLIGWTFPPPM